MSDSAELPVLTTVEDGVGRITLNRPRALNALTRQMCEIMTEALLAWKDDASVELVLIDHNGQRGFCAGGDIRMIAESGAGDAAEARAFFLTEYRLNHLMMVYPKPIVAVMDGIVMGGGVGISQPAHYRIVTEHTLYAMPETGIGLFPDVGGGWHLPRLPGQSGLWLALTGARLRADECMALGIATHYVESVSLNALKVALRAQPDQPRAAIERFDSDVGEARIERNMNRIDRYFAHDTLEEIFAALDADADGENWAFKELRTLKSKSPQAMKITLRQLREGAKMEDFAEVMAMEYRLGGRVVRTHDFQEGVRAVIVDKDQTPRWDPRRIEDVSDALLDDLFAPLPEPQEWTPIPGLAG
ncbi:MAG: enoyl-CoA hydratase/isomerase family protein [Caulobacteraceae bacterium]|nr:enoyl-CoA hydratase/isomerase family protein [Caulobacteraceae bacterium]